MGTSGGDEHTLCAFEWSTGTLVAKTVAIVARPLGLFGLVVGQLASKAEDDKAAPLAARRTGRAARALGIASGDGGGGGSGGAGGKAEAAMRLVVYGAASAPKFTTLSPPQGRSGRPAAPPPGQSAAASIAASNAEGAAIAAASQWALPKWAAVQYGATAVPPRAVAAAVFAERALPSSAPAAAHGMLLVGGSNGRLYWSDVATSPDVVGSAEAHGGAPVTALALVGERLVASGGMDGTLHLWEARAAPSATAGAAARGAPAARLVRIHTYTLSQPLRSPKPTPRGADGGTAREDEEDEGGDEGGGELMAAAGMLRVAVDSGGTEGRGGAGGKGGGRGRGGRTAGGRGGSVDAGAGDPGGPLSPGIFSRLSGAIRSIALLPYDSAATATAATAVAAASHVLVTAAAGGLSPPQASYAFGGPRSLLTAHGAAAAEAQRARQLAALASDLERSRDGRPPSHLPSHSVVEAARGQAAAAADPLTSGVAVPSLVIGTARNSLWRVGPLGAVELIGCHHERPRALAPHPKDALCWASVGLDRQLLLWRAPLGAPVSRALLPTAANCVAFSHDGRFLATGHSDGTVRIHLLPSSFVNGGGGSWDGLVPTRRLSLVAVSGAPLYAAEVRAPDQPAPPPSVAFRAPRTEGGAVPGNCALEAVAFSSTGTSSVLVACGGHDRAIRVFELRISPRAPPGSHPLQAQGPVVAAAGGGDEAAALGAALGAALIGRLEPKCCCRGHGALVSALDFSADGAHLFSTSSARELFVWTLPSGARIMTAPSRLPADACCLYGGLLYGADRMGCFPQGAPRAALLQTAHAVREPLERCLDQSAPPPACKCSPRRLPSPQVREPREPGMPLAPRSAAEPGLLLAAADEGDLRLYRSPCVVASAPSRDGRAHCDRLASARFLADGFSAVSAGAFDRILVRWDVSKQQRTGEWRYPQ